MQRLLPELKHFQSCYKWCNYLLSNSTGPNPCLNSSTVPKHFKPRAMHINKLKVDNAGTLLTHLKNFYPHIET